MGKQIDSSDIMKKVLLFSIGIAAAYWQNVETVSGRNASAELPLNAILILTQHGDSHVPRLYFPGDRENFEFLKKINFDYGRRTGSLYSCSAVLSGKMMIFGGDKKKPFGNQISQVEGCSLQRIGSFATPVMDSACNTFGDKVWICFYEENVRGCVSYDGENLREEKDAHAGHYLSSLGVYQDKPFALGGNEGSFSGGHLKVEQWLYSDSWSVGDDSPFASSFIIDYSTATVENVLYIFGGMVDGEASRSVASFQNGAWRRRGRLLGPARKGHRSIARGSTVFHVGGWGTQTVEQWFLGERRSKVRHFELLTDYADYPECFFVPIDFCTA